MDALCLITTCCAERHYNSQQASKGKASNRTFPKESFIEEKDSEKVPEL